MQTKLFALYYILYMNCADVLATSTSGLSAGAHDHASSYDGIFKRIDQNGNGNVSPEEIKQFIVSTGGSSLDDEVEIDDAVHNVMGALDKNHDNTVKLDDLSIFWKSQASTLTVEDVCDWAVHSLHMPEDIRDIIWSNAVTGFDFPDLVAHDGLLISTELGITKRTLKSRLYRGLVMRLMGMGALPPVVTVIDASSISCSEVRLQWVSELSESHGFPTHKYLVQRYEEFGDRSVVESNIPNDTTCSDNPVSYVDSISDAVLCLDPTVSPAMTTLSSLAYGKAMPEWTKWKVICSDQSTFCVDSGLVPGVSYKYRVSAWNAIGRSEYVYIQVHTPSNCSFLDPSASSNARLPIVGVEKSVMNVYRFFSSSLSWAVYVLFGFLLVCFFLESIYRLVETCDRLQKVNMEQWGDNKSIHILGIEVPVPEEMVKVVRSVRGWMVDNVYQSGIVLLPKSFLTTVDAIATATRKNPSNPTGELRTPIQKPFIPPMVERQASANSLSSIGMSSVRSTTTHSSSGMQTGSREGGVGDLKRCYTCKRKFSYMLKSKHYCGSCHRNFCKSCAGHIAHLWPTPCKINSKCLCLACYQSK